jgi:hypothetical protein
MDPSETTLKGDITIINVYDHTQVSTLQNPELTEQYYHNLKMTYQKERAGTNIILVLGYFNSKIGF